MVKTKSDESAAIAKAELLLSRSNLAKSAQKNLKEIKKLAETHRKCHSINLAYRLVFERCRSRENVFESWIEMHKQFSQCETTQRYCARWFSRLRRVDDGRDFIAKIELNAEKSVKSSIQHARLLMELGAFDDSENALKEALQLYPGNKQVILQLAQSRKERGDLLGAISALNQLEDDVLLPASGELLVEQINAAWHSLTTFYKKEWLEKIDSKVAAMRASIDYFSDRVFCENSGSKLEATALISGSLGAGGAERQMVNSASSLLRFMQEGRSVSGIELVGPFEIVVTTLDKASGKDFYLKDAQNAGLTVRQIQNMPATKFEDICPEHKVISSLLPFLPSQAMFGVQRLVEYFRSNNTQVAYLWQDGGALLAALAALIAGVPRIVVIFRGLPPNLRPHLFRPEYEQLFIALANVPGIQLASNGGVTSHEYAKWLGIKEKDIAVVPNGTKVAPARNVAKELNRFREFDKMTAGASHTIGGVFRFVTDKRPLLWILYAREFLRTHPNARFIMVGEGIYLEEAKLRAKNFDISDRFLFVGQSSNVAFWLQKFDAFVLLSRFEGLPNVLIEAQMQGVPVVSTRAGSAEEVMIVGKTGLLITELENPSLSEAVGLTLKLIGKFKKNPSLKQAAIDNANKNYSIDAMINSTVKLLTNT